MTSPLAHLVRVLARDPLAALVTVVGAKGSTPREPGARMVVTAGGEIAGTIGGGRLELEAIEAASAMLARGAEDVAVRRFALGPQLGQCCGGHVTVAIETIAAGRSAEMRDLVAAEAEGGVATRADLEPGRPVRRRVVGRTDAPPSATLDGDVLHEVFGMRPRTVLLFGAGHVGRAVVLALAPLPFAVTWIDARADMFPAAVPSGVRLVASETPEAVAAAAEPGAFALIMTHDHAADLRIIHAVLAHGGFGFVGLIGSATKRARFESRLQALGLDEAAATSFRCPIGVPGIRSKEPPMIAAAVAAELLIEDERLRARVARPREPLVRAVSGG